MKKRVNLLYGTEQISPDAYMNLSDPSDHVALSVHPCIFRGWVEEGDRSKFTLMEACDQTFSVTMNKDQLGQLIEHLKRIHDYMT